ncbi:hypothetical protein K466DRAFT_588600 [Polyporus arcularius HHB13444]|uniref:Uncharacterized protein n=1 Tax=Polyporus arcularius HHB13444 TaxID=1314778 RepID=A0A5C3P8F0_9APHY|nr:hypothetical protein K466DRAFT_588600 [Polyporus arcularius HHB13444]
MLSLPQPGTATDARHVHDHPLVHLSDSPEDLKYLFGVVMPAKVLRPFDAPQTAYDRVAAFIRMGHK